MRDRQTGLSQGFAFLEFTSHLAAQEVLNMYDGKQIPNTSHVLRLNWAAFGLGRSAEGVNSLCQICGLVVIHKSIACLKSTSTLYVTCSIERALCLAQAERGRSRILCLLATLLWRSLTSSSKSTFSNSFRL